MIKTEEVAEWIILMIVLLFPCLIYKNKWKYLSGHDKLDGVVNYVTYCPTPQIFILYGFYKQLSTPIHHYWILGTIGLILTVVGTVDLTNLLYQTYNRHRLYKIINNTIKNNNLEVWKILDFEYIYLTDVLYSGQFEYIKRCLIRDKATDTFLLFNKEKIPIDGCSTLDDFSEELQIFINNLPKEKTQLGGMTLF